jgi:hypothetical protein
MSASSPWGGGAWRGSSFAAAGEPGRIVEISAFLSWPEPGIPMEPHECTKSTGNVSLKDSLKHQKNTSQSRVSTLLDAPQLWL